MDIKSDKQYPKMPTITIEQITGKPRGKKRSSTSNKKVKGCKKTKIDRKNMSAIDFNEYLKTLRRRQSINVDQEAIIQQSVMPTDNVDEMGVFLKQIYSKIEDDETILMNNYLQLGVYLRDAQKRFKLYKKESKDEITWYEWLYENTKISGEKARQLTGLAKLVEEYPKLKDLQISFTCMRAMKTKIESVFKSNPKIALEWK